MYASLGCGALSAKCTAGSNILGYFLFSWARRWILLGAALDSPETPFAKTPFSWLQIFVGCVFLQGQRGSEELLEVPS